jgi:DNA-binding transcriptional MerR regulator
MSKSPEAFRTISEVADELDLPQHVLRFWETRFAQIKPLKRGGGRRYYRPDDVNLLRGIRFLLYGEGYTIRGVQRILKEQGPRFVIDAGRGAFAGIPKERRSEAGPESAAREPDPELPSEAQASILGEERRAGFDAPDVDIDRDDHEPEWEGDGGRPAGGRRPVDRLMAERGSEASSRGLAPGDVERLQATLAELLELKRLLDGAR